LALILDVEKAYVELPRTLVRLARDGAWIDAWALIDTGADVSLFDTELASGLALSAARPDRRITVSGIGGTTRHIPFWRVTISPAVLPIGVDLLVGFAPGLAKSTGNLLGRDFLESLHFGLDHRSRLLYLGSPSRR
jgi:hypothetical protein